MMNKNILIKNIYYMLTYAFQVLKQSNYEEINGEDFDNIYDLLSEILVKGVSQQVKQGLYKEYIPKIEELNTIRGKININETIQNKVNHKQQVFCEYDELTTNNIYNQIINTTLRIFLRHKDVDNQRKVEIRRLLRFFNNIDELNINAIPWKLLNYSRNNQSYEMLLNICYFTIHRQLLSNEEGNNKILAFTDEYMHKVYERFILEYYKYHYPKLNVSSKQINWDIDPDDLDFMPKMITDIYITDGKKILIIDAKYYGRTMQSRFDSQSFHSQNLYQIMSYVTHSDPNRNYNVKGMLLYAKTNETVVPNKKIKDLGYAYEFTTLDLNVDFNKLSSQLDSIICDYFG